MAIDYTKAQQVIQEIDGIEYLRNDTNVNAVLDIAYPGLKETDPRRRFRIAQRVYLESQKVVEETEQDFMRAPKISELEHDALVLLHETDTTPDQWGGLEAIQPYINPQ